VWWELVEVKEEVKSGTRADSRPVAPAERGCIGNSPQHGPGFLLWRLPGTWAGSSAVACASASR